MQIMSADNLVHRQPFFPVDSVYRFVLPRGQFVPMIGGDVKSIIKL